MQCECVLLVAAHLGNKVIFYQLSPLTTQVTVKTGNATQTILRPFVLETAHRFEKQISEIPPKVGHEAVTSSVAGEAFATQPL